MLTKYTLLVISSVQQIKSSFNTDKCFICNRKQRQFILILILNNRPSQADSGNVTLFKFSNARWNSIIGNVLLLPMLSQISNPVKTTHRRSWRVTAVGFLSTRDLCVGVLRNSSQLIFFISLNAVPFCRVVYNLDMQVKHMYYLNKNHSLNICES